VLPTGVCRGRREGVLASGGERQVSVTKRISQIWALEGQGSLPGGIACISKGAARE